MGAQHLAQRLMQEMGCRMVGADLRAARVVDFELRRRTRRDRTRNHLAMVHEQPVALLLRVGDGDLESAAADDAGVAHLAAGLAIKRRLVHHQRHGVALASRRNFDAVAHDGLHHAFGGLGSVSEEFSGAQPFAQLEPDRFGRRLAGARPAGARLRLLAFHRVGEAGKVHGNVALAQRILREVQRKTVCIVKLERRFAVEHVARRQVRCRTLKQAEAARQRLAETGFLELQRFGDQRLAADQFGIGLAHLAQQRRHQPPHQRLGRAQKLRMAHGAPHDAAQHVTAALVRRQHAVGDEETRGPKMIGNHPVAGAVRALRPDAGRLHRGLDQRAEQVDVVIVVFALHDGGDTLEAHAGVDRRARQVDAPVGRHLLELHEDEVPYLDETVAVLVRAAGGAAGNIGAVIVEDFRTRAAGTGVAHGPEIIMRGDADDALVGQAGDLLPETGRIVVGMIDGDEKPRGIEAELPRDQVPGQFDGDILEIVAERKIAEHLEKGVMARGVADIVEIIVLAAGAHAFLRRHGARVIALFQAGEDVLELHHAGIGEHQRRVVARHERTGWHDLMSVTVEIVEKSRPYAVDAAHCPALVKKPPPRGGHGTAPFRPCSIHIETVLFGQGAPGLHPPARCPDAGPGAGNGKRRTPAAETQNAAGAMPAACMTM